MSDKENYNSKFSITPIQLGGSEASNGTGNQSVDKFGIKMIYPNKDQGNEWYINSKNLTADNKSGPPADISRTPNSDGSWKINSSDAQGEYNVYTKNGYNKTAIDTYNHGVYSKRGFIQSSDDWKNVEMTAYFKINRLNGELNDWQTDWNVRGGMHTSKVPPQRCEGTSYRIQFNSNGLIRFAKEQFHVFVVHSPSSKIKYSIGDWVGLKFIVYNLPQGGGVKLQAWVDLFGNEWVKVLEYTDRGQWGTGGELCNGTKGQLISWGGPVATFQWENLDVDIKDLSLREIELPRQG